MDIDIPKWDVEMKCRDLVTVRYRLSRWRDIKFLEIDMIDIDKATDIDIDTDIRPKF